MQENIEKPEIENIPSEQKAENKENIPSVESSKENNELVRKELLQNIYVSSNASSTSGATPTTNTKDDKTVSNFVKEFYSIGVKAIQKAKKVLNPYGIDKLHDEITDKNKDSHKQ